MEKKRALLVNAVCGIRSTGRICADIAEELELQGYEVKIAYSRVNVPEKYQRYAIKIGTKLDVCWHALMTKLFDARGNWSIRATLNFVKWAEEYNPDLLWIHNIHDYVVNLDIFFAWIKRHPDMEVRWTQHDCWAFTGGCMHFVQLGCNQWIEGCQNCPHGVERPFFSFIHREKEVYEKKKYYFNGIKNMKIIAPSIWMKEMVQKSFLGQYDVEVCNNKIDTSVFKPTESSFRQKHHMEDKFIILGVSSAWCKDKGLDDFCQLAGMIDDSCVIVMVGLTKKQIKTIPASIYCIERTNSKEELAELYSTADVFVNMSYADTYPTVNLESDACGTPVICYDVAGCKETVQMENSRCVSTGDIEGIIDAIYSMKNSDGTTVAF